MEKSEVYKGFVIAWQDPPMTSAWWEANIASDDPKLLLSLPREAQIQKAQSREDLLAVCRRVIDAILG